MRIDFQFDTAAFDLRALPFKIPYPVPFKLFGDETKARPCASLSASCVFGVRHLAAWQAATETKLATLPRNLSVYDTVHGEAKFMLICPMV